MFNQLKDFGRNIKQEVKVYQLILRDKRTPRMPKILLGCALSYLFLPIDIIPDFIPVIGYLDDLIIVPTLIIIALKMIPKEVIDDCRKQC